MQANSRMDDEEHTTHGDGQKYETIYLNMIYDHILDHLDCFRVCILYNAYAGIMLDVFAFSSPGLLTWQIHERKIR